VFQEQVNLWKQEQFLNYLNRIQTKNRLKEGTIPQIFIYKIENGEGQVSQNATK
jgi:hypothetical protein